MHAHALITEADIKAQAQLLKAFLHSKNVSLNHMTCLDAVSVQYGYPSWQHARASVAQHQAPALAPDASLEEQATLVGSLIVQFGDVHKPGLLNLAQAVFEKGPAPSYKSVYMLRGTGEGIRRSCSLSAKQPSRQEFDVSVCAELFFDLRFENDVLYVEPTVLLDVTAAGEIDWQCGIDGKEFALSLADPTWPKELRAFVQSIPVQRWVQDELDARGTTLKNVSAHFEKVLIEE